MKMKLIRKMKNGIELQFSMLLEILHSVGALERSIAAKWNFATKPKFYYHNKGYFVLLSNSVEDMNGVLYSGPHTINNRPIILKVIIGDFKTILEVDDRVGSPVEIRYFSDFFQDMDVSELKSVGRTYTWTNSHSKAIVNAEWKQKFTHLEAEVMNLGCSDHSPIAIMLDEKRSIGG
ncbi:hypothetical protein T459_04257 [Capsicum annuum]|uniref:DUF4283 domain-containing protein n=1 Tax=Capsicum annuum TaxID=4072 RepID=A0A2G3A4I4_CAPAN|nr:hypothetical protein FXO37_28329 [Capsicum annuum]PHT89144.1 hypothetical protein T459_04257 [Capsicum annuum]